MKLEISVEEAMGIINGVMEKPGEILSMIRADVRERVGEYLSGLMEAELTHFLGRKPYERGYGGVNHRNGSYLHHFGLKGIGEIDERVPRDREGKFRTQVIPRSKRYEEVIKGELSFLFLTGISTRSLSMLSRKLLGSKFPLLRPVGPTRGSSRRGGVGI